MKYIATLLGLLVTLPALADTPKVNEQRLNQLKYNHIWTGNRTDARAHLTMVDVQGFGPNDHGGRITTTYNNVVRSDAGLIDTVQVIGDLTDVFTYANTITNTGQDTLIDAGIRASAFFIHGREFGNHGIVTSSSTSQNPSYGNLPNRWTVHPTGRPVYIAATQAVDWVDDSNILGIFSAQNSTGTLNPDISVTCDDDFTDPDLRALGLVFPLCGAFVDALVFDTPGHPSDNFLLAGAIIQNTGVFTSDVIEYGDGAIAADGEYIRDTIYVRGQGVTSTSHAAAALAGYAQKIAARLELMLGRKPLPKEIKEAIMDEAVLTSVPYYSGRINMHGNQVIDGNRMLYVVTVS